MNHVYYRISPPVFLTAFKTLESVLLTLFLEEEDITFRVNRVYYIG